MEKENHLTEVVSRKETWAEDRRARFEQSLLDYGWAKGQVRGEKFLGRQMPDEMRFVKGGVSLHVDDGGAFLYEFIVHPHYLDGAVSGTWKRTKGISDNLVDASPPGFLRFFNRKKLDLATGLWVKKS